MTALRRIELSLTGAALAAAALAVVPASAQNAAQPVVVTTAPPASSDDVGPSQLRDFSLGNRNPRPADSNTAAPATTPPAATTTTTRPAPSATPTERPATTTQSTGSAPAAATPQRQQPTRPQAQPNRPQAQPNAPVDQPAPSVRTDDTVSTPAEGATTDMAPSTAQPVLPETETSGDLPWAWIAAAVVALAAAGLFLWTRRAREGRAADPGRLAFAGGYAEPQNGPSPDPVPEPVRPAPVPRPDPVKRDTSGLVTVAAPRLGGAPVAPPPPKPKPVSDSGMIVSTSLKPSLNMSFVPERVMVTDAEALVQFEVVLNNHGAAPARDVLVEAILVTASAAQDQQIAAFFEQPNGEGDRIAIIPPMGKVSLKSVVRLPLAQVNKFEMEGRVLFVPLVAFNLLFRGGGSDGQASASYLVGRGKPEDDKLGPIRLDLGARQFRDVVARLHSTGLTPVA